jgi:hypothetical protein
MKASTHMPETHFGLSRRLSERLESGKRRGREVGQLSRRLITWIASY